MLNKKDEYINALIKEIKFYYQNENLKTIYFGGGTPSLLETSDIEKILNCLNYNDNTQITLELNPHNIELKKLKDYQNFGINRLSVGVQSFDDYILDEIGRTHTKKDIYKTLELIEKTGFSNVSLDLMYGLPSQDIKNWIKTLDEAIKIQPSHISLYGLKIEEGTYFKKFPPKNLVDDDIQATMQKIAYEKLEKKYIHYEFSNFAKNEDFYSIHNIVYWKRQNYYGFGLSASGFIQNKRYTNTFNFSNYIKNPLIRNYEILTKQQELEEEIFLGLRLKEGLNFEKINKKYNIDIFQKYEKEFKKFLKFNFFEKTPQGIKLTLKGVLVSNEILCEFIKV